jgi:hypothetical protein
MIFYNQMFIMDKKTLNNNIERCRLLGDFIGTLEGILFWEIDYDLEIKLKNKIDELRKEASKITDDSRSDK